MKIIPVFNSLLPKIFKVEGIAIYPFILFRGDKPGVELISHELAHIAQYRREGFIKFLILYIYYHIKYGYAKNPFEIEARKDWYKYKDSAINIISDLVLG